MRKQAMASLNKIKLFKKNKKKVILFFGMYKRKFQQKQSPYKRTFGKYGKYGTKKLFRKTFIQRNKLNAITKYSTHKAINPKLKTLDIEFSGAYANPYVVDQLANQPINVNNLPIIQNIATVQQGAAESQRIGNKIALKSLRVRLQAVPTSKVNGSETHARFMVVYDRQTNGTYPAANNLLSSLDQAGTTIAGKYLDSINPNYLERYVVLADEYMTFQPVDSVGANNLEVGPTGDKAFYIDRYIKLRNLETQFNGSASPLTIGYVTTGALYLLMWGDAATPGTDDPWMFIGNMRLRFHDC